MMLRFWKRKEPNLGNYIIIEFSPYAKERAVGGDLLKRIYYLYDGYVMDYDSYSRAKHLQLMRDHAIIIDRTRGQEIPKDSRYVPETRELLGQLQISRMV